MSTGFLPDPGNDRQRDDSHGPDHRDLTRGFVPFPADRADLYRRAGYWTGRPLDSILTDAAATWPAKQAIVDATQTYTFAELDALADRVAAGLAQLGIAAGDRVLLQLPNSCQFAVALFGLLRARGGPGDVPARAPDRRTRPLRRGQWRGGTHRPRPGGRLRLSRDGRPAHRRACIPSSRDRPRRRRAVRPLVVDRRVRRPAGRARTRRPRSARAAAGVRRHHRAAEADRPHPRRLRLQRDRVRAGLPHDRRGRLPGRAACRPQLSAWRAPG